jgi:hypothetical protein
VIAPNLPRSVVVLGQRFKVYHIKDLSLDASHGEHSATLDVLGICDSDEQVIFIEQAQGKDKTAETFLHENLHAIIAMAGLREELADNEEVIVKRLAPIMLDWLRRNPNVYTFLTGRYTYR